MQAAGKQLQAAGKLQAAAHICTNREACSGSTQTHIERTADTQRTHRETQTCRSSTKTAHAHTEETQTHREHIEKHKHADLAQRQHRHGSCMVGPIMCDKRDEAAETAANDAET